MNRQHAIGLLVLAGVVLIVTGEVYLQPDTRSITEISKADIGKTVRVHGTVKNIVKHESIDILTYESTDIPVIDFEKRLSKDMVSKQLTITGTVELYQGKLEILVSKIS